MKLSRRHIQNKLATLGQKINLAIDIHASLASTNTYLLDQAKMGVTAPKVCLAELQTAGRGTHGRKWHSPAEGNLYCSLLWQMNRSDQALEGLGLVVGLSIVEALKDLLLPLPFKIKWPNDIYVLQEKLAGVLIEKRGQGAVSQLVIGIGLNVNMTSVANDVLSQAWTSLSLLCGHDFDRNVIVANLLNRLIANLQRFEDAGFISFKSAFEKYDALYNQSITLEQDNATRRGFGRGVTDSGCLQFQPEGNEKMEVLHSGHVLFNNKGDD